MIAIESTDQFNEEIKNGTVIALFTAGWCPDCRFIEPFLPEIEEKYSDIKFLHVDRDDFMDICEKYDVIGIPSFVAFKDGNETKSFISKDRKTQGEIEAYIDSL